MRANSRCEEQPRGNWHGNKQLHLVVKQAAVIEEADERKQRRACKNADNLAGSRSVHGNQNSEDKTAVDGNAAEQRNRLEMNFARAWFVHKTYAKSELANRRREPDRGEKRDQKR
jgi:hypothetical protein